MAMGAHRIESGRERTGRKNREAADLDVMDTISDAVFSDSVACILCVIECG